MSTPSTAEQRVNREINREHVRELCAQELQQLSDLSQQLNVLINQADTTLRRIEQTQQRILGIIRVEIQHAFTR